MSIPQAAASDTATNYLTMLVRRKGEDEWEVVGEDIAIVRMQHSGIWNRVNERVGKLAELYPVEEWLAWTLVTEARGIWRGVFEAQQHQSAPSSTVRRVRQI
jgi:hypothetical protein